MANKVTQIWTVDKVKHLLTANNKMVERSLLVLYSRQTMDERAAQATGHPNGMGLNKVDAEFLSSLAEWIKKSRYPEGRRLTAKQLVYARKRIMKYAKQLTVYANSRTEVEVQYAIGSANTMRSDVHQRGGTFDD